MRMDDLSTTFRQWMDDEKLTAADVAHHLSVSEQTIHNWRSAGIPPRRQPHVRAFMAKHHTRREKPFGNSITVHITDTQFDSWNRAAMREQKTILEWAVQGLDELAAEHEQTTLKVADDPNPHPAQRLGSVRYGKKPS